MAKRRRGEVIRDRVKASDFNSLDIIYCCEKCTYFESSVSKCNLGMKVAPHLKESQMKSYRMGGKFAFCRFLEID